MKALRRILTWLLLLPVRFYSYFISPWLPPSCRYTPTCSAYARQALEAHGPAWGSYLAVRRMGRCHPWCEGGHDPVPAPRPARGSRTFR